MVDWLASHASTNQLGAIIFHTGSDVARDTTSYAQHGLGLSGIVSAQVLLEPPSSEAMIVD